MPTGAAFSLHRLCLLLLSPKVLYLRWQPSILLICTVSLHAVCTYEVPRFSLFPLLVNKLVYGTDLLCYRQGRM